MSKATGPGSLFTCVICWDELHTTQNKHYHTDKCNHNICGDCISTYLNSLLTSIQYKNRNKKLSEHITCPSDGCQETFQASDIVKRAFEDTKDAEKWWRTVLLRTSMSGNKVCFTDYV